MIRVVVIDDSAFMRKALSIMLESDPEIKVIGTARDGEEGFQIVKKLKPDLVTLDVEMPRTNGIECLKMIMREVPTPVLLVSSITTEGAKITLEALNLGAVDYIPKSQSFVAIDITKIKDELIAKVKNICRSTRYTNLRQRLEIRSRREKRIEQPTVHEVYNLHNTFFNCIAIGVSTGGPPVIQRILASLPGDFPLPILIAQHMPLEFTRTFADRLNNLSAINVKEAATGDVLQKGSAYIGQGGMHLIIRRDGVKVITELTIHPREHLYHPSADILFSSVVDTYGSGVLGLILTGMGKDGLIGLKKLKEKGGKILAQNEETCIVYGMPKAAVDAGITDAVLSVDGIIESLKTITN